MVSIRGGSSLITALQSGNIQPHIGVRCVQGAILIPNGNEMGDLSVCQCATAWDFMASNGATAFPQPRGVAFHPKMLVQKQHIYTSFTYENIELQALVAYFGV
jgi:hypothetical protein